MGILVSRAQPARPLKPPALCWYTRKYHGHAARHLGGFGNRCHPSFDRDCGCRSHLRRRGTCWVCVKACPKPGAGFQAFEDTTDNRPLAPACVCSPCTAVSDSQHEPNVSVKASKLS